MFGCIVAGRLVQTNLDQINETSFIFTLPNANEINHLTVFLLGTIPFPEGYGATVHIQFPGHEFRPLGTLTNAKPSAIYRVKSLRSSAPSTTNPVAVLGIQIVTMDVLATVQAAVSGTSTDATAEGVSGILVRKPSEAVGVGAVAEKVVKNLFNYLHSFEGGPATLTPETPIPLRVFQKWYDSFLNKIRYDNGASFLERDV